MVESISGKAIGHAMGLRLPGWSGPKDYISTIPDIPGTQIAQVKNDRSFTFIGNDDICKFLKSMPLILNEIDYRRLIGNDYEQFPDCFIHWGKGYQAVGKFGASTFVGVSPVVVNKTLFSSAGIKSLEVEHTVAEDYSDMIPYAVLRARTELMIELKKYWEIMERLYDSRKTSVFSDVAAMTQVAADGKLERYLDFYHLVYPLSKDGKPISGVGVYEWGVKKEALDRIISQWVPTFSKASLLYSLRGTIPFEELAKRLQSFRRIGTNLLDIPIIDV